MNLCCEVLKALGGKTLVTAESLTGGGIGAAVTAVPGSSRVYKGGVICYSDWVKANILGVDAALLEQAGAVSAPVAQAMASGVRKLMRADVAIAVTGLAGPGGDAYGNDVGTVFIAYEDSVCGCVEQHRFQGDREQVRGQTLEAALHLVQRYAQASPSGSGNGSL